jgi:hypothetical protein
VDELGITGDKFNGFGVKKAYLPTPNIHIPQMANLYKQVLEGY